jgi:hypothetical protein
MEKRLATWPTRIILLTTSWGNKMNASELMEELKTHIPNAPIVLLDGNIALVVTSVMKSEADTAVRLVGQRVPMSLGGPSPLLAEALAQGVSERFKGKIIESADNPGKFQVSIDDYPAPAAQFDSRNEALAYMRGFTVGYSAGG